MSGISSLFKSVFSINFLSRQRYRKTCISGLLKQGFWPYFFTIIPAFVEKYFSCFLWQFERCKNCNIINFEASKLPAFIFALWILF
ncbi:MAG TPA: hypothetical protein DCX70_00175 [Chitinophagaceae bacterium]|nr:hypothetical protein [Chitinophagaceae bacterium]